MADSDRLHLSSLSIKGFRGIDGLTIPELGRVTLLAGKNSVGKTTVLDAVEVYASRGNYSVLSTLLRAHDEVFDALDEDRDRFIAPDWPALFHGRKIHEDTCASIGPAEDKKSLRIECVLLTSLGTRQASFLEMFYPDSSPYDRLKVLKVVFREHEQIIPWVISDNGVGHKSISKLVRDRILRRSITHLSDESEMPAAIECVSLGPGLLSNNYIARFWDKVALTDAGQQAIDALELILTSGVAGVAAVGDDPHVGRRSGRRVMIRLKNHDRPVPLRSLGDGATRLFSAALALANSRDGFLLIDEAENGIHHSVQADYWRLVLQTAQDNNVQVLATTHSWDCVRGFAQAASENEDVEGVLVRLEKDEDGLYTVEYSEERLQTAAEHDIEVR